MTVTRKPVVVVFLFLGLALLLACNLTSAITGGGEQDAPPAPPSPAEPVEPPPDEPAIPEPQLETFSFHGVDLAYDPGFVTMVTGELRAGNPCDFLSPNPANIAIHLTFAVDTLSVYEATIAVYPVQEFIDLCDESESPHGSSSVWVLESLNPLRDAIESQSGAVNVPPLPMMNAGEPLHVRGQYVAFQNGAGVRAIVTYAHDVWFFSNDALSYSFQGLTSDGEYYVMARFPVNAPFLLDGPSPAENTNPDAIPIPEHDETNFDEFIQVVEAYNQEARRLFGVVPDPEFTPDLSALDAVLASLLISPSPQDFVMSPGGGDCTLTADQDITIYNRPTAAAEEFSTMPAGFETPVGGVTADGWYGFDPGVAQAANIGVFRLRWVDGSSGVTLSGDCSAVPEMVGPAAGVCFTMPMGDVPVYTVPDATSALITTLTTGDYAAVLGRTAGGWAQIDLGPGNTGLTGTGWIEAATLNMNGPCEALPTLTP